MRTTLNVDDELLSEAKAYAAQRGRTVTLLVEEGLRKVLAEAERQRTRDPVVFPTSRGATCRR